ncbi:MAG: helix-turn-helix domain-containing protein [Methanobacteriota archaeon]
MIEAVLRVRLPCSWVTLLTERHAARIDVVEQKAVGKDVLQSLVEIDPGQSDPEAVVAELRKNPYVVDLEAIVPRKGRILATIQVRDCHACQALSDSDCFLTDATATADGGLEWHILASKRASVNAFVATLTQRGIEVELVGIRSAGAQGELTDRQQRVLDIAYRLGYYELPKKINLSNLASKLGVSKSTLSEMLRIGEAKILHTYFHGLLKKAR